MTQNEVVVFGATIFNIGLSQVIRWTPPANVIDGQFKILSGSGSLEIVEPQLSGSSTATGAAWGKGYMLGASDIISFYGPAAFYFAATSATMSLAFLTGRTAGATIL